MSHTFARTLRRAGALRFLGDRALADLASAGDPRAADTLVARHEPALCRLVAALLGDGPVAAAVAAEALDSARDRALEGLPADRSPRLALLAVAQEAIARRISQSAVPAIHSAQGGAPDSPARELARLPLAERSAMVLTGTLGLGLADAALLLGTTPAHVDALVRAGENDLTAFPPSSPECVDARAEDPASGALAAHATRCPPCAAFSVERSERRRRLAVVAPVVPVAAAPLLPPSPTEDLFGSPPVGRGVARIELAVLGTVGLVIASVGVTLGVVMGTRTGGDEAPVPSAEDLRPRPLPDFPEVVEVERVRQVARPAPRRRAAAVRRVRVSIGPSVPVPAVRVTPRAPSPARPSVPRRAGPGAGTAPPPAPAPRRPAPSPPSPPPSPPTDVAVVPPAPPQPAPAPPPAAAPSPAPVAAPTTGAVPPSAAPTRKRHPVRRQRPPVVTGPPSWVPGPPPTTPPPHVDGGDDDQHAGRRDDDRDEDRPRGRGRGQGGGDGD